MSQDGPVEIQCALRNGRLLSGSGEFHSNVRKGRLPDGKISPIASVCFQHEGQNSKDLVMRLRLLRADCPSCGSGSHVASSKAHLRLVMRSTRCTRKPQILCREHRLTAWLAPRRAPEASRARLIRWCLKSATSQSIKVLTRAPPFSQPDVGPTSSRW